MGGGDDACELVAGDPGEGGLPLVVAGDLEQVEEVGAAGVHGDGVLVGCGFGLGDFGEFEIQGALQQCR